MNTQRHTHARRCTHIHTYIHIYISKQVEIEMYNLIDLVHIFVWTYFRFFKQLANTYVRTYVRTYVLIAL